MRARRRIPRLSGRAAISISALLFLAILGFRTVLHADSALDATLILLVIPVAVCAIWFVDQRRALEARVERHFALSLDLFCTATFEGYFEELNPAWERTLGYTSEELSSRPFLDFVHPDDRERTQAEAERLNHSDNETIRFRNRYRKADGEYLWLEWASRAAANEGLIYATARDITVQKRAEQALQAQSDLLERRVRERTQALEEARLETLDRLAIAAEYRDDDTHQHTQRVGRTAALIATTWSSPPTPSR